MCFVFTSSFGQTSDIGSWSIGSGISNSMMHGDLRSGFKLANSKAGVFNLGGYTYIDKMFTPVFGLELKGHYTKMSGGAFELSEYPVQHTSETLENTRFEGTSYGVTFNIILNLSSLRSLAFSAKERKWNFATYTGIGWHSYKPILYNNTTNAVLIDWSNHPSSFGSPNSIYFTVATGLKYKLSKNLDIELRQSFNMDEEDNLDGARSNKKYLDFFFNTNLGIVFKLNKKEVDNYTWIDETALQPILKEKDSDFSLLDSDNDGVIDLFDKEPNTEKGALVYGNGVTIDSDKDSVPDHKDKCPLRYAPTADGCPLDSDGDGVLDDKDRCPNTIGKKSNFGCPESNIEINTASQTSEEKANVTTIISVESVFFDIDQYSIAAKYDLILTKFAILLTKNTKVNLLLEGYADASGDASYNKILTEKRIRAVKKALITRGVDPLRISTENFGENKPSFKNNSFKSYNRRVDLILTK